MAGSGFQHFGGKFANSVQGGTAFSALSGGIGAELSGGDFWRGAGQGASVALLNHYAHQVEGEWNEKRASNKRAKAYAEEAFEGISLTDLNDAWLWTKNHFYIGVDGEITYGAQLALTLKNGLGINFAPKHEVVLQGAWNNRKNTMLN